ncbi:MAG: aldo/keto reductase [Sulfurospirillaceae bacterium]|nr:aldo/keto reductase [Sulfurospirillaceae bacterium]
MYYYESLHNVKIPYMIYGTAWKKERTADLVEMAVLNGFRGIDTACQPKHYEEALVGVALSRLYAKGFKREELFVQTKFTPLGGQDPNRIPYHPNDSIEQQIATSFEVSKANLQTSYIDSFLLHSPLFPYSQLLKAWKSMEELHHEGGVKQLGISNCYDLELLKHLWEDATLKPSVVQNRFYSETNYDKELRAWCHSKGILYQGFWTLTANPHMLAHPLIQTLAQHYHKTPAQLWYRYLTMTHIIPLIGSTSLEHLTEDVCIDDFSLTIDEIKRIATLLA